ncbi:MAG: ABC transporter permease [Candidatus Zixiibacteriota bacterium]
MYLKLAFRNIFRQKRRSLLTFIAMLGGFTLASISIAWQDGTYIRVIEMFTRVMVGHIQMHKGDYLDKPSLYKNIENYEEVVAKINENPKVKECSPRVLTGGLAAVGEHTAGVQIIGIDPKLEDAATSFNNRIKEGKPLASNAQNQALLGTSLADFLEAGIGDSVVIISQAADGSMANDIYQIAGLYSSGNKQADRAIMYLHIDDAQEVFVLEGKVHEILVNLNSIRKVSQVKQALEDKFAGTNLKVQSWKTVAASFYKSMQADRNSGYFTYAIIMAIVAVGILNTVVMNVLERTKEFGVLKALGTRPGRIFSMIMVEVFIMAIASIIIGSILSTGLVMIMQDVGVSLPDPMEVGGVVIDEFSPMLIHQQYWIPAILVIIMSMLVAIIPAVRASNIKPAEALRSI